jgi:hypothetical protein
LRGESRKIGDFACGARNRGRRAGNEISLLSLRIM